MIYSWHDARRDHRATLGTATRDRVLQYSK